MKTVTIRLPDVEAAMLDEIQRENKESKELLTHVTGLIRKAYAALGEARERRKPSRRSF